MHQPTKTDLEQPQQPVATPPTGLGVYDRPERRRLSLAGVIILLILAVITFIIVWQLWL